MADEYFIVVNELSEDLVVENELFEKKDDLIVFSAVSCFMRRDLNRIKGYFEKTVPAVYAPSEFRSHFRMTRGTSEVLRREIINTGRIPHPRLNISSKVAKLNINVPHLYKDTILKDS